MEAPDGRNYPLNVPYAAEGYGAGNFGVEMANRQAVIAGAGITGVLVARELLQRGWRVTLLEAKHVGAGSSSRSAAGIRQQFSTAETITGMRYSVAYYRQMANETSDGQSPIKQNGYLFLHDDETAWVGAKKNVVFQHECGLAEVEALEHADLIARFPWLQPEAVVGGTYCPTDGFLFPHVIYAEGARLFTEAGGTLLQNAPVQGCKRSAGRLTAFTTPHGDVAGDLFIDCTNAWTNRLARRLEATPLDVDPLKRYLWFLERGDAMPEDAFMQMPLTVAPSGLYFRPENPSSLMMGKKHDTVPEPGFSFDDQDIIEATHAHQSGTDAVPFEQWFALSELVPAAGEFEGISATTAGYYATTPDHNPFLGYDPRIGNLMRLVGFSGHGAMLGPFTAACAAELAETGRDVDDVPILGHRVSMDAFKIGRTYRHAETMVI